MISKSMLREGRALIAAQIAGLRQKKGLTQKELAEAASLRRPNISRGESGKYNPTLDTLLKIARVLECEIIFVPKKINYEREKKRSAR